MASPSTAKGSVVLVQFPFDDLSSSKVRPAVCLTEPIGPYSHIVLAFINSTVPREVLETDLMLDPNEPYGADTGLRVISTLRLHRLLTVSSSLIRRELGHLSAGAVAEVNRKLLSLFGLG